MRKFITGILVLFTIACSDNYQELRQDIFIQKHFNRNQSKDLASMVKYFDGTVCQMTGRNSIKGLICYRDWFDIVDSSTTQDIYVNIDKEDQWEFSKALYKETVEAVWLIKNPSAEDLYKELPYLALNLDGPYLRWLKSLTDEDDSVREYYLLLLKRGIDSDETRACFKKAIPEWPMSDPRYRLIIAIDQLTMNSQSVDD